MHACVFNSVNHDVDDNVFSISIFLQAKNTADYYRNKFDNIKRKARQREVLLKKQLITGGGQLSKAEQRIVKSQAYTDLVAKLGISASGNEARADSDGGLTDPEAPTNRLRTIVNASDGIMCLFIF